MALTIFTVLYILIELPSVTGWAAAILDSAVLALVLLPVLYLLSFRPLVDEIRCRRSAEEALRREMREREAAELARRESEARFQNAFEHGAVGMALVAPEGRFVKVNRALCDLTGYAAEELVTRTFQDLTHPADLESDLEQVRRMLAGDIRTYQLQKRYLHKSGQVIWILLNVSLVRDAAGKPLHFVSQVQDITERMRMQEELVQSNARNQAILDSLTAHIALLDPSGVIIATNLAWQHFARENGGGPPTQSGVGANYVTVSEQAAAGGDELAQQLLDGLRSVQHGNRDCFYLEYPCDSPTGARWFAVRITRLGGTRSTVLAHENITEWKQAQARLQLQAAALEAAANAILITDRDGTVTWVNPAFTKLTGYSSEEIVGQNPRILQSGQQDSRFYQELWDAILSGRVWHSEVVNRRKDGALRTEDLTITPVRDESGEIRHFIGIRQDITERKELEAKFLRAQRMETVGALAGGIAHDLNNVLAPILMATQLLQEQGSDESTKRILEIVTGSAQRGADMVKQILSFSRGVVGEPMVLQLKHVVKDLAKMAEETFPRSIRIQTHFAQGLYSIVSNPTQIHQVLLNLCVNARDAMPDGGKLVISVSNALLDKKLSPWQPQLISGPYVLLSVADTGIGMPPEVVDRIFEPFFTTKGCGKGTGLGLSTVQGIVKAHGGFVEVSSEPNKGTTFNVYLPAAPDVVPAASPAQTAMPPLGNNEQILVIDDELALLEMSRELLLASGYRVLTARDGIEALSLYQRHKADIHAVVTDMMMPLMDGPTTIDVLRTVNPRAKIIGITGLDGNDVLCRIAKPKVRAFLNKPYPPEDLLTALHNVLVEE